MAFGPHGTPRAWGAWRRRLISVSATPARGRNVESNIPPILQKTVVGHNACLGRFTKTTDGLLKKLGGTFQNCASMALYVTNYLFSFFFQPSRWRNRRVFTLTWEKQRERLGFTAETLRIVRRCLVYYLFSVYIANFFGVEHDLKLALRRRSFGQLRE